MNFRIRRHDKRNILLEELVPGGLHPVTRERGEAKWVEVGAFGKLPDLIHHLLSREIAISDGTLATQIPALLAEIRAAEARIVKALVNAELEQLRRFVTAFDAWWSTEPMATSEVTYWEATQIVKLQDEMLAARGAIQGDEG